MVHSYFIGIDCGTTNVKAVIYNQDGEELFVSNKRNQVLTFDSCSEQDMLVLWNNVKDCIKNLMKKSNLNSENIKGIGISAQGEGLWAIDKDGNPVRNAILWNDGRAIEVIEKIKSSDKYYIDLKKKIASYIKPGSTLTLIKWLYENEKNVYDKIDTIFSCKDYIRYRLTGNIDWEYTDATCSCINMNSKSYATDEFIKLGILSAIEKLPELVTSTQCCGRVNDELAEELGLPRGLMVSGGMLDIVSTVAGTGASQIGDVCVILGTTGMTLSIVSEYEADEKINGWELYMDGVSFVKGMGTMAATPNLDWAITTLYEETNNANVFNEIDMKISKTMPGDTGLIYHPHIAMSGERAPFFNSNASAQLLGICQKTEKIDIIQAVMEGVALSIKDCLQEIENLETVYLSGGGAKNKVWAQMIANAVNAKVVITNGQELAAKGAALSAAIMCQENDVAEFSQDEFVKIVETYKPEEQRVKLFEELYSIYKSTQKAMEVFWEWRGERR